MDRLFNRLQRDYQRFLNNPHHRRRGRKVKYVISEAVIERLRVEARDHRGTSVPRDQSLILERSLPYPHT